MSFHYRECDPIDHMIHLQVLREMEEMLPMTYLERKSLNRWVCEGNDPELTPWSIFVFSASSNLTNS